MSKINRSTYQHQVEINKRLLNDIRTLVGEESGERQKVALKWFRYFKNEKDFEDMLRKCAIEYIRENKENLPHFLTKGL